MKTILIADDEVSLRLLVRATLDAGSWQVVEAADGREALRMARDAAPDLVVIDWTMPELSGVEVTRILREDEATRRIPVIMLTARSQERDVDEARLAGVTKFLTKPFSPMELMGSVAQVLG